MLASEKKESRTCCFIFSNGRIKKEFWFVGEALPFLAFWGVDAELFYFDDDSESHFFVLIRSGRLKTRFADLIRVLFFM